MRIGTALLAALLACAATPAAAQQQDYTAAEADKRAMLDRLGIATTRPGADGFNKDAPNAVNYDEAKAVMAGPLPPLMRMSNGMPVTSARQWWTKRRPEIVALFDQDIYGRVPATAPRIAWKVVRQEASTEAGIPVVRKWLEGTADNRAWPRARAVILLRYTLPANTRGKVPVILSFGFPEGFEFPGPPRPPEPGPSYMEQLLAHGFGYATVVANSIQADNGGLLKDGVIGISLAGKLRGPADWGVLRAWAWGADRAFDALAMDAGVDAKRIGIEGLSRYGKAALVTMAYDPRFAIGFIGSSGAGGAALYRRNFGERMGNLCAGGEYHWFAGNFLKYCAALTEADLPIDSHLLIALAAPRPLFIGAGTVETGDGWVDPKGSFLAAVAASPAWTLLGKPGLSTTDFPPVLTPVVGGELGFRQHQGGHNNRDNWPTFIAFAEEKLGIK
ncbi:hypothetical protein [Sphingomonas sp.]|uniref:glucuronyl esterase domain-containing protein n=1 Tax=Sphingomonas sp. TaxID=28214 RepID=UPI001B1473AC|nr:hypothetical protein [Sphingomonas sp.]MBO9714840.1 hypothetical protein [Sphingomonas sp.]